MEISARALGRRRVIAAQPARSDKRDRRVTVGGGACGTVGGVISAKVGAVGCVSDSGSPWRGGARANKIGLWRRGRVSRIMVPWLAAA